jgi:hypothetical protein
MLPNPTQAHDSPINHATSSQPRRMGWVVIVMALLLIPLGLAAYLLIQSPAGVQSGSFFENEDGVLTGATRRNGSEFYFHYEIYSLRTGQTHEITSAFRSATSHNTVTWVEVEPGPTWHVKQFDAETFATVSLGKVVFSAGQVPRDLHAAGLIAGLDQKNNLFVSDPRTGTTRQLELPALASNHVRGVAWCDESSQLIVSEYLPRGSLSQKLRWYAWANGQIELRDEWTASSWPHIADKELLRIRDNHDLEILRLADGTIAETQSLRDRLNLKPGAPLTLVAVEPPVAILQMSPASPKSFVVYDYRQQRILGEVDGIWHVPPVIRPGIVTFEGQDPLRSYQLSSKRYSWDGTLLSSVLLDERACASRRTADGKRLMVLRRDESVLEIDLATGKSLRIWRSNAWVVPTLLGVILGFCVWYGCWIRLSHHFGWHPMSDVAVWNGLIAAGLFSRGWLYGPGDTVGVVFECLALSLSWMQFAAVWLIFGSMRWSLRALAPMLAGTAAVGALLVVFRQQPSIIPLTFGAAAIGMLILVGVLYLPYRWGWRLAEPGLQERSNELRQTNGQMPLRDLFAIVGGVALFLAVVRFVPFQGTVMRDVGMIIIHVVAGLGSASAGVWAALSRRHWTVRLAVLLGAILAFSCLPGLIDPRFWSWKNWWKFIRFPAATAVFVVGSLLAFRVRGLRWMRIV